MKVSFLRSFVASMLSSSALFGLICLPAEGANHGATGDGASAHLEITGEWSRALPAVSPNGAVYFVATNRGERDARLVAGQSPIARRVELHTHIMEGGLARMREVPGIDLPAGTSVELAPGGLHVMLMGLVEPLTVDKTFPLTLRFADHSTRTLTIRVMSGETARELGKSVGKNMHGHGKMRGKMHHHGKKHGGG